MRADLVADHIENADAFAALAPEWWDLWRRCPSATPFQSPAWLLPWWQSFRPGALFAVTIRQGARLVGLAPFYIEHGSLGPRVLPIGISLSDYLDVLIDPAIKEAVGQALVGYMMQQGARWDEWDLEELAPDAAAHAIQRPAGCAEQTSHQSACPVLVFSEGASDLKAHLPPTKRRKLNLARNRANRRGAVVVEAAAADTAPAMLDVLFRLHGARWESRGEAGVLADDPVRVFQRAVVPGLMEAGLLRLHVLRIGGEPAAAYYGFMHRQRAYAYLTGLNPDFAHESPGVLILAHVLERALAEGAREAHFLRGQEPYKYEWGGVDRWNSRRSFRTTEAGRRHA
jgi:CelD/BcsL family acetyltransferase involved in cellulose biosynthesis